MSDRVETVAAEDAPINTEGGEAVAPAQNSSEQPQATTPEAVSQDAPVAETAQTEDEPLVEGPVGEALDDSNDNAAEATPESHAVESPTSESQDAPVAEKAEIEEEPLVEGPVGEVLDDSNDDAAEATPESHAVSQPEPMAEQVETEDEPLIEGPVGEVLDDSNDEAAPETHAVESSTSESQSALVAEAIETEDKPLMEGPMGEILDDSNDNSNDGATAEAAADSSTASDAPADAENGKSNVRILSVGQQVSGNVKRIADFGAFVDIGVGRDGLIHISELSVRRVGKVTDVLSEGQEVTAWIKKLDRDRNRISLTLIDPNTKTIRDLNKDDLVQGTVTRILPYGAFVDIGIGRDALLHVREMGVGYVAKPEDVVKVGDTIEARIIELSRRRGRVDLSLKGLREEPEPTPQPQVAMPQPPEPAPSRGRRQPEPEPEPEPEEDFEDLEVLSPMELAFKRAMEAEGMELNVGRKKQSKRNRRERNRSLQDEIISRTLSSGRK